MAWRNIGRKSVNPNLAASQPAGAFFSSPTDPGAAMGNGNRIYDDGFARIGAATMGSGITTSFGYQNSSQVDLVADTLTFRSSGGTALENPRAGRDGDSDAISP